MEIQKTIDEKKRSDAEEVADLKPKAEDGLPKTQGVSADGCELNREQQVKEQPKNPESPIKFIKTNEALEKQVDDL